MRTQRFQSTHPRRVRLHPSGAAVILEQFQSTHPRRVRRIVAMDSIETIKFQSTHPRRVRRPTTRIHRTTSTFQSTHPRRVRLLFSTSPNLMYCFNPRTHVGCDTIYEKGTFTKTSFNPRTHVGCDKVFISYLSVYELFQSTHPRRVRPFSAIFFWLAGSFQSTHPRRVRQGQEGCDRGRN